MLTILTEITFFIFITLFSSISQASPKPYEATPAEVAMMPKGCQVKLSMTETPELQRYWDNQVGPGCWGHIHHFCHGLKSMMRANSTFDKANKRFYLEQAVGEFDYVLQHCPGTAHIIPEVKTRRRLANNLLNLIRH